MAFNPEVIPKIVWQTLWGSNRLACSSVVFVVVAVVILMIVAVMVVWVVVVLCDCLGVYLTMY